MPGSDPAPEFSVAVLVFNTGQYVVQALESLRAQSRQDFEVIVVDDASTDDSVEIVEAWVQRNPGIRAQMVRSEINAGIPASLNRAVERARGRYVTWLCDDLWDSDRLEKVSHAFSTLGAQVGVVFGDAELIDAEGQTIGELSPARTLDLVGADLDRELLPALGEVAVLPGWQVRRALFWRCFIPAPSATVRRDLYAAVGTYDEGLPIEDLDFWFRIAPHTEFGYARMPLVRYRLHGQNMTSGRSDEYLQGLTAILGKYVDPASRSAVRRHVREESYRVAMGLLGAGLRGKAFATARRYYIPNLSPTLRSAKETVRLATRMMRPSRSFR
jgi:glycosyltransferase involved in cell wall biosynthesis